MVACGGASRSNIRAHWIFIPNRVKAVHRSRGLVRNGSGSTNRGSYTPNIAWKPGPFYRSKSVVQEQRRGGRYTRGGTLKYIVEAFDRSSEFLAFEVELP